MRDFVRGLVRLIFKDVPSFLASFLASQWRQYNAVGQGIFVLALVALAVDAAVSYQYGKSITTLHAIGYAVLAIAFAILPDLAAREGEKGNGWTAVGLLACCLPLGIVALQSHIGYTGGVRLGEMSEVAFHQAKLEGVKQVRDSEATNLDFWRKQLGSLSDEKAALLAQNPWATSVTADALRSEVKTLDGKIAAEEKGGRGGRRAGCKAECEKLKDQRNAVLAKIGGIERLDGITAKIAELTERIERTQNVLKKETREVADTGIRQSLVVHQNGVLGRIAHFAGYEADAETISLASASSTSIAFMMLAPILMFAAGRNRRPEEDEPHATEAGPGSPSFSLDDTIAMFQRAYDKRAGNGLAGMAA